MQLNQYEECLLTIFRWMEKKNAPRDELYKLEVTDEAMEYNSNLIKNNPQMTLEEFMEKALKRKA